MLKLDEKKIRKGKPIGLPYQGSKKKVSKKIAEIIKQNFGTYKPIYDVFGGGGGKARSVLPDVYNKMRQKLLKMPAGSVIVEDEIEYKLGTHPKRRRRMYVKDLRIQTNSFDSQTFYDWAFEMSKKNIVLISSYEISDDRFKCVFEFEKARSTMQSGSAGKRTEKLFMAV